MRMVEGALALAALVVASPAAADGKAALDAWNSGDWPRAVAEWRPLAVRGDPDAQFNLGQAYKLGHGVPIDPVQALAWFKRAADQGHVRAQDSYGIGLFQANRKAEALPYLERAAARGEPRAQLLLGTMLFNGDGVAVDYPRAYALMMRASEAGVPSAAQSLQQMDDFLTPLDRERGLQLAQQQAATPQAVAPASRPAPVRPSAPTPVPAQPAPAPRPAGGGTWRVQLGAFRNRGNAEALWAKVRPRVGGQPAYVVTDGLTRLQATGFADRAAAQRACTAAAGSCVVVAP